MAVGFGFSVSDICNAFKIIRESVNALDDRTGAVSHFGALLGELDNLQEGLIAVRELLGDGSLPHRQHLALERAASSCQTTIEEFLASITKYQPYLSTPSKGFATKFRKIKWALCSKEDISNLRSQLERHVSSINMLLITLQAKQSITSRSLMHSPSMTTALGAQLEELMQNMSLEQRQCFTIIMQQNQELLCSLADMRSMLMRERCVPSQVLLQQPVILLDPFGKTVPFHLDFIDSSECFMAVLRTRFSKAGVSEDGLRKLDKQEFSLEDSQRKRKVDLQRPWQRIFRPGQQVDMRMTFHRFSCLPGACPSCLAANDGKDEEWSDDETVCEKCGLAYQKFEAITKQSDKWELHTKGHHDLQIQGDETPYILSHPLKESELKTFIPPRKAENASFDGFRRIQLVSQPLSLLDPLFPALQLVEDFSRFADLLKDLPPDISPYLSDIEVLNQRAKQFIHERDCGMPAFASFAQIQERKRRLTHDSLALRHYINTLITDLCNDPDTIQLVKQIKNEPSNHKQNGYYAGALKVMVNLTEVAKSKESRLPRPISRDKMEWLMLNGRSR